MCTYTIYIYMFMHTNTDIKKFTYLYLRWTMHIFLWLMLFSNFNKNFIFHENKKKNNIGVVVIQIVFATNSCRKFYIKDVIAGFSVGSQRKMSLPRYFIAQEEITQKIPVHYTKRKIRIFVECWRIAFFFRFRFCNCKEAYKDYIWTEFYCCRFLRLK